MKQHWNVEELEQTWGSSADEQVLIRGKYAGGRLSFAVLLKSFQGEDQELTMLSLHLLQASLVYINTLMIQRVLGEESWTGL